LLREWYPQETVGKAFHVIPCCADLRRIPRELATAARSQLAHTGLTFIYAGKLGGPYPTREMVKFMVSAKQRVPGLTWKICTQSDPGLVRQLLADRDLAGAVSICRIRPEELSSQLAQAHAGLCFYQRDRSGAACSPTKLAEYLAAGLPVVAN